MCAVWKASASRGWRLFACSEFCVFTQKCKGEGKLTWKIGVKQVRVALQSDRGQQSKPFNTEETESFSAWE